MSHHTCRVCDQRYDECICPRPVRGGADEKTTRPEPGENTEKRLAGTIDVAPSRRDIILVALQQMREMPDVRIASALEDALSHEVPDAEHLSATCELSRPTVKLRNLLVNLLGSRVPLRNLPPQPDDVPQIPPTGSEQTENPEPKLSKVFRLDPRDPPGAVLRPATGIERDP